MTLLFLNAIQSTIFQALLAEYRKKPFRSYTTLQKSYQPKAYLSRAWSQFRNWVSLTIISVPQGKLNLQKILHNDDKAVSLVAKLPDIR